MNKDLSTTRKQQVYADSIEKENKLRMKWFKKNEQRLIEYAEKPPPIKVTEEEKEKMIKDRQERYQNVERKIRVQPPEDVPLVDPDAVYHIMRPVDPEVTKLIYSGTEKNGRKMYLHERVKIIPENKYYFQETVNFTYGWKMWNHCKEVPMKRYGRCRIIQESFYRKNNVDKDPDWYQEPAKMSPTTCGAI